MQVVQHRQGPVLTTQFNLVYHIGTDIYQLRAKHTITTQGYITLLPVQPPEVNAFLFPLTDEDSQPVLYKL